LCSQKKGKKRGKPKRKEKGKKGNQLISPAGRSTFSFLLLVDRQQCALLRKIRPEKRERKKKTTKKKKRKGEWVRENEANEVSTASLFLSFLPFSGGARREKKRGLGGKRGRGESRSSNTAIRSVPPPNPARRKERKNPGKEKKKEKRVDK